MLNILQVRLKKLKSHLQLRRTVQLVLTASRKWAVLSIVLIFLENFLFFASLYLLKLLIDAVSAKSPHPLYYLIWAGLISVAYAVSRNFASYATEVQASRVAEYIDDKIHSSAARLDLSFYENPGYFDILKRAKDAGPDRPQTIVTNLADVAKSLMSLAVIATILISIDPLLLPLLVVFVLPTMFTRIHFAEKLHSKRIQQTATERRSVYLSSLLTSDQSAKEIRTLGLAEYLRSMYSAIRVRLVSERFRILRQSTASDAITGVMATVCFFLSIAYIVHGVSTGKTSVGGITLFLVVFPQSYSLLQNMSSSVSRLYQNSIFVSGIFELIDLKPILTDTIGATDFPHDTQLTLTVKNLSFTYPNTDEPTLTDINLVLPPGKIIAIVGFNGAGKTTLIKLLSRLYDPNEGCISINGTDIRSIKIAQYRKQIATVFQDFGKYHSSVSDNIRYGNIDAEGTDDEIMQAAVHGGADEFIQKLPFGYETIMGRSFENGHELSIGQWQKLAISRAFYSPARFIIMDEATSALDALAERELFDRFRQKIGNRTALIVSHRVSAVEHADYIYVFSEGQIKQQGTHNDLLKQEGEYARLFRKPEKEMSS